MKKEFGIIANQLKQIELEKNEATKARLVEHHLEFIQKVIKRMETQVTNKRSELHQVDENEKNRIKLKLNHLLQKQHNLLKLL